VNEKEDASQPGGTWQAGAGGLVPPILVLLTLIVLVVLLVQLILLVLQVLPAISQLVDSAAVLWQIIKNMAFPFDFPAPSSPPPPSGDRPHPPTPSAMPHRAAHMEDAVHPVAGDAIRCAHIIEPVPQSLPHSLMTP
jgi:hypothetical protein